jgi:iron complex outermembrane recepter protein
MIHFDYKSDSRQWAVVIMILAMMTGTAVSYRAVADTATADTDIGLQEIVVTANRREQNLQNVPIAISAVTAQTASEMGITDAQSLAGAIPGLNFNRQANSSIPFLRGIGSPVGESGDEPSVAAFNTQYSPAPPRTYGLTVSARW